MRHVAIQARSGIALHVIDFTDEFGYTEYIIESELLLDGCHVLRHMFWTLARGH